MTVSTQTHSSLVQGISQQSAISRGTASCDDEVNCLNDVLEGVVSRMGSVWKASYVQGYNDPFVHEVERGAYEKYLIIIEGTNLRVINKDTGRDCTVTGSIAAYLAHSGNARGCFQAVTIGDTTHLLNRQRVVAMGSALSPDRPNKACAFFKAGGYKMKYRLVIRIASKDYITEFETPDNSAAGNARFITTDYLANEFQDSLNTTIFPAIATDGHGTFTVVQSGSTLIITGPAGLNYDIHTTDGAGDTHFLAFKDTVKGITSLPSKCVNGYQVSVRTTGEADATPYYLEYQGGAGTGSWVEVVAPGVALGLDAATMPHIILNTGPDTFTVSPATWGKRLAGDGGKTAVDPSFVGQPIKSMQFLGGRLACITEYTAALSRARNAYVYFPDTAQTELATAPIDYDVSNGSSTLIEHTVVAGGKLQFWGNQQQTYLDTGQEAIKADTTEVMPLANYEYDGECPPKAIGLSSLLFGTAIGPWAQITEVFFRGGIAQGEIPITAHAPRLLRGTVKRLSSVSGSSSHLVQTSDSGDLYYYQYYNQGADRVQSAWNRWRFPPASKVVWGSIDGDKVYLLIQREGITSLETITLGAVGDEPFEKYPLRLDHRIDESHATYDSGQGRFVVQLPYKVPTSDRPLYKCYARTDQDGVAVRGQQFEVSWFDSDTLMVNAELPDLQFFIGVVPVARRKESQFYAREERGAGQPIIHEKLLLKELTVAHKGTVEYSVVVTPKHRSSFTQTYIGRVLGDGNLMNNQVPVLNGSFKASIGEEAENVDIELINSTPFPCIWTSMKYTYDITMGAGR